MKQRLQRGLLIALGLGAAGALLHASGVGLPLLLGGGGVAGLIMLIAPRLGMRVLGQMIHAARALHWRREQGSHHSFGGVPLQIEDDGRHVWVAADGLQRVLGTHDRDDVLAARVPGRWRRGDDGALMLRVDAVVAHLSTAPGRMDPRTLRLRHCLERDVLFPAAERRRRKG